MKKGISIIFLALLMFMSAAVSSFAGSLLSSGPITPLMKNGAPFDLTAEAGQRLYGYDTLQGACANGGYVYYSLFNRKNNKCRIVKVELETMNVVCVSAPMKLYHANCLTYNTRKNLIVSTCCEGSSKRVIFIEPSGLTYAGKKDIKISKKAKKIPKSVRRKYKGFSAIAYNEARDCYVGRLKGNSNLIILDKNLKPVRYVKLKGCNKKLLSQSIETHGNYIYDVRSFKGKRKYNLVTIHTLNGSYVGRMKFPYGKAPGNELECIFHDGDRWFAGFYHTTSQMHDDKKHHVNRVNSLYEIKVR